MLFFFSYVDFDTNSSRVVRYKSMEPAYVDQVKLLGNESGGGPLQRAFIKLRICVSTCTQHYVCIMYMELRILQYFTEKSNNWRQICE